MKKQFILTLLFLICEITFSQTAPEIEWQNDIGTSGNEYLKTFQQTSDGGYIVGGYSDSGPSMDKSESPMAIGYFDYWILKLDASGTIVWDNTIGGSRTDIMQTIQETSDGGFIIGGYSNSGISGDKTQENWDITSPYTYDFWVIKIDSLGNIEWDKTIGGAKDDFLYSVNQTSDKGYILGGDSYSGISGDKNEPTTFNSDNYGDYWAVKLDSIGNIEWENTVGGYGTDHIRLCSAGL